MQAKVSMVMPCYNKVEHIAGMLDSILLQKWDTIEVVLINDGSTDGTREIISKYESKFSARGFDAILLDQENMGVCSAAKNGLERITGAYVCMVDSDDELSPEYVSTMAGWLEEHPECDYCVCDVDEYVVNPDRIKEFRADAWSRHAHWGDVRLVERYLLSQFRTNPWVYMLRTDYLRKCNIIETYYVDTAGSHEPGYIIPILANNGTFKYFPIPLYHFNVTGESHSRSKKFENQKRYYDEYDKLCCTAIERLPANIADKNRKNELMKISRISAYLHLYNFASQTSMSKDSCDRILSDAVDCFKSSFPEKSTAVCAEATHAPTDVLVSKIIKSLFRDPAHPKVSIVIPCYNKGAFLEELFISILAQKWTNIEVILVDDGSIDDTMDTIREYLQIFKYRGFEVVIVYQENQGVAAAVRTGLTLMTGEFVCQVDADDELDPEFVSAMASILVEQPDEQWVVCDSTRFNWCDELLSTEGNSQKKPLKFPYKLFESFILNKINRSICCMLARAEYFRKCGVLDSFHVLPRVSQEPQIFIPLALGGSNPVYLRKTLYIYRSRGYSMTQNLDSYAKKSLYISEYDALIRKVLSSRKKLDRDDERLLELGKYFQKMIFGCIFDGEYNDMQALTELTAILNDRQSGIKGRYRQNINPMILFSYIARDIIGCPLLKPECMRNRRIIAYAAYGKAAQSLAPELAASDIRPDVFWDKNAKHADTIDGIPILEPDFNTLTENDSVFVLLKRKDLIEEVTANIAPTPARNNIFYYTDVMYCLYFFT